MNTLTITPSLQETAITATEQARSTRDSLLRQSSEVTTVADRLDADGATCVLRELKAFAGEIETSRVQAKAPALDIGRKIDALAKELTDQVNAEASRISRLVGAFEAEERRKAELERYRAEAEAARVAEEARKAAMAARVQAKTEEEGDRKADAIVEKATEKVIELKQAAALAMPKK